MDAVLTGVAGVYTDEMVDWGLSSHGDVSRIDLVDETLGLPKFP